jgi:deoxyribodipyrimidine photo-lyase
VRSTAIVWFRRDLRLHDHPALHRALHEHDRVVPVFVFDPVLIHGRYRSGARTAFMLGCLRELDAALCERGSGLVIREGSPATELVALARECAAGAVLWAGDAGPYARARDAAVTAALRAAHVEPVPQPGNFVADIGRIHTGGGKPYTVYSPFRRAWEQAERRVVHHGPGELPALPAGLRQGRLPSLDALGLADDVPEPVCPPGEAAAREEAGRWFGGALERYGTRHDTLQGGTSTLSPAVRWGLLSVRELEERARRHTGDGPREFLAQLCWRDFYAHVLLHHPDDVRCEHQERYRGLRWSGTEELLEAWQQGRTGYPAVDAGMRQLSRTGWMHNRARLITGSFLTKDLHRDWREGELWFARKLLDGEPLQNNGNWQWVASVGVDPAPYFRRLFNPTLQARKFDPDGAYIRAWIPELRAVPAERIHEPWTMTPAEQEAAGCRIGHDYPAPIVDHAHERRVAIERYREAAGA